MCRAELVSVNEFKRLSPEVRRERGGNKHVQTSGTWGLVLGPGLLVLTILCVILYRCFCSYLQSKLCVPNNEVQALIPKRRAAACSLPCGIRGVGQGRKQAILRPTHVHTLQYGTNLVVCSLTGRTNDAGQEEDTPSYQLDSPRCKSEVLDATSGMQELEDAIADSEGHWHNSKTSGPETVSHTVQIRGITMKKSHTLTQQFQYVTSVSSTDCLHCVAQEGQFKTTGSIGFPYSQAGDAHIDHDRPTLSVYQPIATVIECKEKPFLCITEVNGLFLDHQPIDEIPISVLSERVSQVSYQGLRLVSSTDSDDPDGKHDWRSQDLF